MAGPANGEARHEPFSTGSSHEAARPTPVARRSPQSDRRTAVAMSVRQGGQYLNRRKFAMRMLRVGLLATALALAALAVGPPLVGAITSTLFVTSTLDKPVDVDNDGIELETKGATDVHVQQATFAPGDVVDWHNHPGFALITVKSGTMTFLDPDCTAHKIGPGQAFVESGGPTKALNEGNTEATFFVTYVVPHGSPRIVPTAAPDCASAGD
jgi:quercetin dioxygenase-like cupin family protein